MLRIILTIVFVLLCIAMTVIVLMQSAGLGAISGAAETYWGKNKGRSMEGKLEKFTKLAAVLIFVLALVLNLKVF